jgi:hypothetical protein
MGFSHPKPLFQPFHSRNKHTRKLKQQLSIGIKNCKCNVKNTYRENEKRLTGCSGDWYDDGGAKSTSIPSIATSSLPDALC